jgi:intracellular septation protein A
MTSRDSSQSAGGPSPDKTPAEELGEEIGAGLDELADAELQPFADPTQRTREAIHQIIDGALPVLVFFVVYRFVTAGNVRVAALSALATALVWGLVRLVRGDRLRVALLAIAGAAFSSLIAIVVGEGRAYFLPLLLFNSGGILLNVTSVVLRHPLTGIIGRQLRREDASWRQDHARLAFHTRLTLIWTVFFVLRTALAVWLYAHNNVAGLAFVSPFVLKPSFIALLVVSFVWGERSRTKQD